MEQKAEAPKKCANLEARDKLLHRELHMNMKDLDAKSRIQNLFINHHSLLRRNILAWILQSSPKDCRQSLSVSYKAQIFAPENTIGFETFSSRLQKKF